MDAVDGASWTGSREPNTALAWVIIGVGCGLLALSVVQSVMFDASFNLWFFALLVAGMAAYAAISFTSRAEMNVQLDGDQLVYTKRELSLGRVVRESSLSADRSEMARVVERNAGLGVRVVRVHASDGRKLMLFPEFLDGDEHDAMMAVIIQWANQSSSEGSGGDETPVAESR